MNGVKAKRKGFLLALMILGVVCLMSLGSGREVSAATKKCKVTFANIYGNSSASIYKNWSKPYQKINSGSYITLPEYKSELGYKWVIKNNGKITKTYKPGAKVKITEDVTFCLKPPTRTVRFYSPNGGSEFTSLRKTVYYGASITLPSLTSTKYKILGWKTSVDDTEVIARGTSVKVTENLEYYISVEWASTDKVNLRTVSGKLWKVVDNSDGTEVFPSVSLGKTDSRMFLGWASSSGQTQNPEYYENDTIPSTSGDYYMVVFTSRQDTMVTSFTKPKSTYDRVYFVGDSRTVQMEQAVSGKAASNVKFIAQSSQGLEWFKETGWQQLYKDIKSRKKTAKKAVIINLGVNDMSNVYSYVDFMVKVAAKLEPYNCSLYYMSVNPVNTQMAKERGTTKSAAKVENFNAIIYSELCSGPDKCFTYINTCTNLMKKGWLCRYVGYYGGYDGVHYTNATYSRIYDYAIRCINKK